jgi:hypothetical protein
MQQLLHAACVVKLGEVLQNWARSYQINTNYCRERIVVEFFPRTRAARAPACRRKFTKIYEIPRVRAAWAPCAEKVSMSEMAASARTTKGDPEIPY